MCGQIPISLLLFFQCEALLLVLTLCYLHQSHYSTLKLAALWMIYIHGKWWYKQERGDVSLPQTGN